MLNDELEVTVDGISHAFSSLNDEARKQVANLQFVEGEIVRLNNKLAVCHTAMAAYKKALSDAIPRTAQ